MKPSTTALTPLALSLALGLGACGSSSSGLSRSDLAKQANKICADGQKQQLSAGSAPSDFRTNPTAAAAFLDKYVPIIDGVAAKLKGLKPAANVRDDWNAFAAKFEQATAFVDSARTKAHNRDKSGIKDIQQAAALGTATSNAATKVGATTCAK
ncbi:MAG: hypothetical protein ACR2ND_00545 [Solirubrobacteraceae bacterium]